MKKIKLFSVLLIAILSFSLTSCMHTTDPGYASVINQKFGSAKGVQQIAVGPGTYFAGVGETYYDFPTFQVNWVFTIDKTEGSEGNEEFTFQTKEGMECAVDLGLSMQFDADKLPKMYTTYRKGVEEIRSITVRNEIRDALNRISGGMPVEYVYGEGKGKLVDSVYKMVRNNLAPSGIKINRIYLIGSIRIPESIKKALDAKVAMTQKAQQKQNEVAMATAQANINIATAKGLADSRKIEADGEAYYNQTVSKSLTPGIVELKRIDKWKGVYPTTYGVNGGLLIK